MKQETNNEMDLLLRRLGRRAVLSAPQAGDHLDADELSAYAENVLPAAARTRYTEHLAECGRCRELVVQLSAAAGVVVAAETVKVAETSALKKFLASLLSPMVLRYAAPALGLIVVAVIGVVVLRRNSAERFVAQVQPSSPAPASASPNQQTETHTFGYYDKRSIDSSREARAGKPAEDNKSGEVAVPNSPPSVTVTAVPSPERTSQKTEQVATANEPPVPAKAAPKPGSVPEDAQQQVVVVEQPKGTVSSATPAAQSSADRDFRGRRQDRDESDSAAEREARAKRAPAAPAAARSAGGIAKLGEANVDKVQKAESKEKDDSVKKNESAKDSASETRSAGGRRFRKERGIWIDTAYNSESTTNLTRGSEQFRALVADEPTIKTIADQLDGEFVVVWKGRAYRIR